jgi:hypothetical protein
LELSPQQMSVLERLVAAGFRPVSIPPYEKALCVSKGNCGVALAPAADMGFRILAPAAYLVDGNFGVRLKRGDGEIFIWKKAEVTATPERMRELEEFKKELDGILEVRAARQ